jgi:hypothetical protein
MVQQVSQTLKRESSMEAIIIMALWKVVLFENA